MTPRVRWLLAAVLVAGALALALFLVPGFGPAAAPRAPGNVVHLTVTERGFEPPEVRVEAGRPVTLVVTRITEQSCATELVVDGQPGQTPLPLNRPVTLTLQPRQPGLLHYGCAMGRMMSGLLRVE
jgi:plastocyanin domain-containing protein